MPWVKRPLGIRHTDEGLPRQVAIVGERDPALTVEVVLLAHQRQGPRIVGDYPSRTDQIVRWRQARDSLSIHQQRDILQVLVSVAAPPDEHQRSCSLRLVPGEDLDVADAIRAGGH